MKDAEIDHVGSAKPVRKMNGRVLELGNVLIQRYILTWKLCTTTATDVADTLRMALMQPLHA
jgi:hypothetical protein